MKKILRIKYRYRQNLFLSIIEYIGEFTIGKINNIKLEREII